MGIMDKLTGILGRNKDKAVDAVDKHSDTIEKGVDKAGALIDTKTGGKFSGQIAQGKDKVKDGLDSLDGQQDDFGNAPPSPPTPQSAPAADTPPAPHTPAAPETPAAPHTPPAADTPPTPHS